jgi:DNA-binding NarL/FixJ family response regulator
MAMEAPLRVLVVDPNPIYRTGLVTSLSGLADVECVHEAASTREALDHPAIPECDVILIDGDYVDAADAVRAVLVASSARVVVCSSRCDEEDVMGSVVAGAVGYLSKETLTPAGLAAAVHATTTGGGIVAPELLGSLLQGIARISREVLEPRGLTLSRLTEREQSVLKLVADGHSTREIAVELSYSERTVKNILHDVVTKFNARTRSQAVAHAVRQGLI